MNRRPGSTGVMVFRGISARRSGTHRKWSRSCMSARAGDGSPLHASPPHVHRPPGLPRRLHGNKVRGRGGLLLKSSIVFSKEWSQFTIDTIDLVRIYVFRYLDNPCIMNTLNELLSGILPYESQ